MTRLTTLLVLLLAGRAAAEPEVVQFAVTEGPFASAFDDKCRSIGEASCTRIASARTAPFERVELHEAGRVDYVALEHAGRWFIGPSISINGVSDPTTSQRISITFVRFTTAEMPELGKVVVIRIGLHVTIATHCSRHSGTCVPGAPDYKSRVTGEYDDDAFVVCGIAGEAPRCTPPVAVPEELVRRPPFTGAALVLSDACQRFDWSANGRSYDHRVPSPCRYELAPP